MPLLTETYEGVPGGMNLALPPQEIADDEARYLQDVMLHLPGEVLMRGPVQAIDGMLTITERATGLVFTLDPNGNERFAILHGDNSNGYLGLLSQDLGSKVDVAWNGALPTNPPTEPYRLFDSKAALTGGCWIGTSSQYDANSPVQTLAHWRGANKATYTTGTLSVTRGAVAVTGSGTSWLANVVPGMFLFANTDDPYTNAYIGVVKSVNSDTSITLGAPALHTSTAKSYTAQSIRGFCPRVVTGRLTASTSSTAVTGALTKFIDQGMNTGTWHIYRSSDYAFVGKVSSVTTNTGLTLTANAAVALNNERYIAHRIDGDFSINTQSVSGRKVGFLNAIYAERQWFSNLGQEFALTSRLWFSDTSDPEAVDLSPFDGDFIDVGSSHGANTPITALMPATNALVVFKDSETFGVFGSTKTNFQVKKIEDDGTMCGMSVQPWGGGVIWAGRNGVWFYNGIEAENLTLEKLGDYYKNAVRTFDPTQYRMWSMVARDHYFLHFERIAPNFAVVKGTTSETPTKYTLCINMVTRAVTLLTNVAIRGSVVLPATSGQTTWYLVNSETDNAYVCDAADLFDSSGQDEIASQGAEEASRNLCWNPSFETNIDGWYPWTMAVGGVRETIAQSAVDSEFGTKALLMTALYETDMWAQFGQESGVLIPVTGGETYTLSAYLKQVVGNRDADLEIDWYSDPSTYLGFSFGFTSPDTPLNSSTFTRISMTATAPANANYALLWIGTPTGTPGYSAGDSLLIDGVLFEQADGLSDYFDGDSGAAAFAWAGTAHASESIKYQAGPEPYLESKKYKVGDSLRKKLFKQLAVHYLAQGAALKLDTVVGLNNVGKTSLTTLPETVYTWDNLPALFSTWDTLDAQMPTWDALIASVFRPKRIKFLKRSQHLAFRIYPDGTGLTKMILGPFQLGFKQQRPGRV